MKYYDLEGNEIPNEEIDWNEENGWWEDHQEQGQYHEGTPEQLPIYHYEAVKVYFSDGTSKEILSQDDTNLKVIDAQQGIFEYKLENESEDFYVVNFDVVQIEDSPYIPPTMGWYDYESYMIYHPYTPEQKASIEHDKQRQKNLDVLMEEGLERIQESEMNIEDLILIIADIAGGEEEV